MNYIVVRLEGVVADWKDPKSFDASDVLVEGARFVSHLSKAYYVFYITECESDEAVKTWVRRNFLDFHIALLGPPLTTEEIVEEVRGYGALSLVVESIGSHAAETLYLGVPTLLMAHPMYMRPEYRPNMSREVRLWQDLENEASHQRTIASFDERFNDV